VNAIKVGAVVLAAIWACQAIVFLVSYRRQRRNA